MLSVKQRRTINAALTIGSLEKLCVELVPKDQAELVKWLRLKFRGCIDCGEPLPMAAPATRKRCERCIALYAVQYNKQQYQKKREYYADYQRRWRDKNPERARQIGADYAAKNPDIIKAKSRRYRERHRAECIARTKAWGRNNPDKVKQYSKTTYLRRMEKLLASGQYEAWRDARNAKHRAWYAVNGEAIRTRASNIRAMRKRRVADPKVVLQWPYTAKRTSENEILLTINAIIPRHVQGDLRGDVGHDVYLASLDDSGLIEALLNDPAKINRFITAAKKRNYEASGYAVSLDQPMRDGRSWHDVLGDAV